jgi:hypothetical protein
VKRSALLSTGIIALAGVLGCSPYVASLTLAVPHPVATNLVRMATSRGWRDGESCRFWLVGIPSGLPKVDEAIDDALAPVHGILMRDVTVRSVHPVYGLFGWHCYRIRGEAFAP